ncbi:abscission/NoCut checkpoint regulator [Aedes albopictus]|uniref:FYVE-type domain-containing protein n=1 Tax=Aedes albopictus TaxID=7160 RepID=A0ABM1Z6M4_AEDAL
MACNGCTKRFGFFLKENGCPSCKYSFCSKCLKYRMKIEGKARDVCLRCYELSKSGANSKDTKEASASGPSILDVPVETAPVVTGIINPVPISTEAPPDSDTDIRRRLDALKRKNDEHPSESEISPDTAAGTSLTDMEKRLAALKGIEYKDYAEANKKFLLQKDDRSEEEQIRDLMKQFAEEQEIHDSMDNYRLAAVDDIEKRLAALKDVPADNADKHKEDDKPDSSGDEGEENDEEVAKKLAARFLEEAAIDAKKHPMGEDEDELNNLDIPTPLDPSETEELPWCTICNEDAVVRCVTCGGDLFCRACFKEIHDDEEYRKHEIIPYKAKTKS